MAYLHQWKRIDLHAYTHPQCVRVSSVYPYSLNTDIHYFTTLTSISLLLYLTPSCCLSMFYCLTLLGSFDVVSCKSFFFQVIMPFASAPKISPLLFIFCSIMNFIKNFFAVSYNYHYFCHKKSKSCITLILL